MAALTKRAAIMAWRQWRTAEDALRDSRRARAQKDVLITRSIRAADALVRYLRVHSRERVGGCVDGCWGCSLNPGTVDGLALRIAGLEV